MSSKINVIRYDTLLECFEAFIGKKVDLDEASKNYWVGHDGHKEFKIRFDKWLKTTRKCWGWAEYSKRKLHIWISNNCSKDEVIILLSHELGHFQRPRYLIKADEEKKASLFEKVTRTAIDITNTIGGMVT